MSKPHLQFNAIGAATARIAQLRNLSYEQAIALPETASEEIRVNGVTCSLTVFRQMGTRELGEQVLVTVLVAQPAGLGIGSHHTEQGLMFSPTKPVREATSSELQNTGG